MTVKNPARAGDVIGETEIGDQTFTLHRGLGFSVETWFEKLDWRRVAPAYRALTNDLRANVDRELARRVVIGELQHRWYQTAGRPVPEKVQANQTKRIEEAKMATTTNTSDGDKKATKKVDPADRENLHSSALTVGGLIRYDLLAGKENAAIIEHIRKRFPDSKAGEKDIAYYRYHLRKEGRLKVEPKVAKPKAEKPAKAPKAKKEKKAKKAKA